MSFMFGVFCVDMDGCGGGGGGDGGGRVVDMDVVIGGGSCGVLIIV